MTEPLTVAFAFRIDDDQVARIEALDPRIRIINLSEISGRQAPEGAAKAAVLDRIAEAEVILGPSRIPIEYFDAATRLRWFQCVNAGIERMERDGLLRRGFAVTTAAGLASSAIAEYVIGSMVMLAKGLHRFTVSQQRHAWEFRMTGELSGKTVGILGLGEIGRETARRARAFNMRVIASRRTVSASGADPDCDELVSYSELDYLLERSDYLVVAVPLTPETHHLLGAAQFARMRPTASIVNVARGEVIDQPALIEALRAGTIASAALDVFDPEPLPAESLLWDLPNVIITPHISGAVEGYGHKATELFIANLRCYLDGQPLAHLANPELGY